MSADDLLTPADLAEKVKATPERIVRLCRERGWPHVRMGRAVRFTPEQYAQIVAMQTVAPKVKVATPTGQTAKSARRSA